MRTFFCHRTLAVEKSARWMDCVFIRKEEEEDSLVVQCVREISVFMEIWERMHECSSRGH